MKSNNIVPGTMCILHTSTFYPFKYVIVQKKVRFKNAYICVPCDENGIINMGATMVELKRKELVIDTIYHGIEIEDLDTIMCSVELLEGIRNSISVDQNMTDEDRKECLSGLDLLLMRHSRLYTRLVTSAVLEAAYNAKRQTNMSDYLCWRSDRDRAEQKVSQESIAYYKKK